MAKTNQEIITVAIQEADDLIKKKKKDISKKQSEIKTHKAVIETLIKGIEADQKELLEGEISQRAFQKIFNQIN